MALGLVTIHHEGAGDPSDVPRGAGGGYTYWMGVSRFIRLRSPYDSYATLGFNHVSVDVCLSGNRMLWPVTHDDLVRLIQVAEDARGRGELIGNPMVRPHKLSPGSNTVCPGVDTIDEWPLVIKAFQGVVSNPQPPYSPQHPTLIAGSYGPAVTRLQNELNIGAGQHLVCDGSFGPQTQLAVHAFQAFMHLGVDGIVGPQTWAMLDYCYAMHGGK